MEKIENIDLAQELGRAENEILEEKRKKIRARISAIIGAYSQADGTVSKLRRDLVKAEASVKRHQDALLAIKAGKWDILKDESDAGSKPENQA